MAPRRDRAKGENPDSTLTNANTNTGSNPDADACTSIISL